MGSELPTLFLFLTFLGTLIFTLLTKQQRWSKSLPPGPRKLPIIGNLHQLGSMPHISLQKLSEIHGPLMFLRLGSIPTLVVSSADAAREIFKTHDLVFSNRPQTYAVTKLMYGCSDMVFAPHGHFWSEVKKIMMSMLLSPKKVESFKDTREAEVTTLLKSLLDDSHSGPINLSESVTAFVSNLVCRLAFGKEYGGDKRRFYALLDEAESLLGGFCVADFYPCMNWLNKLNGLENKAGRVFKELDMFYDEVIEEHLDPKRPESEHEDLVDVLLRVQKDERQAIALSDDNLKGVFTDIFMAGTSSSSATLEWTMSELMKNPGVMKRATDEVRGAVEIDKRVKESDVEGLVYLKAVVKEGLRLNPPSPLLVPRETTEACTIGDYTIPAKTRVFVNARSIATDPKYWQDPERFWPDRFLNSSVDFRGQDFELLPFGAGRRGCPGINFAVPLVELLLANLLHHFDWELPQGMKIQDVDMEGEHGITMRKKLPLRLVARPVALLN